MCLRTHRQREAGLVNTRSTAAGQILQWDQRDNSSNKGITALRILSLYHKRLSVPKRQGSQIYNSVDKLKKVCKIKWARYLKTQRTIIN